MDGRMGLCFPAFVRTIVHMEIEFDPNKAAANRSGMKA
jgi:hypothetical protein